jgi:hypothetical protein
LLLLLLLVVVVVVPEREREEAPVGRESRLELVVLPISVVAAVVAAAAAAGTLRGSPRETAHSTLEIRMPLGQSSHATARECGRLYKKGPER